MQWSCDVGEAFNERAVKIEKSYCPSYFGNVLGRWPCVYTCNFYWVHACHPLFKDYPQVNHGGRMERALLGFELKVVIERDLEDVSNHGSMSIHVSTHCNADVVHVYPYGGSSEFVFENGISEDVVHHSLKRRQGVGKSKVHDCGFEESVPCFKHCLSLVSLFDTYVVVSPPNIQLCIYMRIAEVSYEV